MIVAEMPEVAILDLRMPARNGLNVLRDVKASNPATKTVILTNYPIPQVERVRESAGGDESLPVATGAICVMGRQPRPAGICARRLDRPPNR